METITTLDDIIQQCSIESAPPDADAPTTDMTRPWWVVVVNPYRQPPKPKFYVGHFTRERAEQTRSEQQARADAEAQNDAQRLGQERMPLRYFVLACPPIVENDPFGRKDSAQ